MALTYNRKTGNYEIRIRSNGKGWKKVLGKDKRKAEQVHKEMKEQIRKEKLSGERFPGADMFKKVQRPRTFGEEAQAYLEERADYKASSLKSYRSILNAYLLPAFADLPVKDMTGSRLRKYQAHLATPDEMNGNKLSGSRVNTIMQLLRSILKQAENEGTIDKDPSKAVRRVQESRTKIDPLSDDELEKALAAIPEHFKLFFLTQAFTGARPNELQALRWFDIDWNKNQINISKGRVRGVEGLPKTRAGDRIIPLPPTVKRKLEAVRADKKIAPVVSFKESDYVFTTKAGNPIDKHLDRVWNRALIKAGIRHRPSYQLRHTYVTRCINEDMPLPYIARLIGHSTIDTLVRHYAGLIEAHADKYEQKLRATFDDVRFG